MLSYDLYPRGARKSAEAAKEVRQSRGGVIRWLRRNLSQIEAASTKARHGTIPLESLAAVWALVNKQTLVRRTASHEFEIPDATAVRRLFQTHRADLRRLRLDHALGNGRAIKQMGSHNQPRRFSGRV